MSEPTQNKVNVFVLAGALGLISAVATAALVGVFIRTKGPIEEQKNKATNDALMQVLPGFDNSPGDTKIIVGTDDDDKTVVELESKLKADGKLAGLKNIIGIYTATKDGKIIGFAGEGKSPIGFGGDVKVMVGLDTKGKFLVGIVTGHQETPGLGTVVTDRVESKTILDILGMSDKVEISSLPANKILDQFKGKVVTDNVWKVKKDGGDVDFITGATISSRAVTDAFYKIASAYSVNKEKIAAIIAANNKK